MKIIDNVNLRFNSISMSIQKTNIEKENKLINENLKINENKSSVNLSISQKAINKYENEKNFSNIENINEILSPSLTYNIKEKKLNSTNQNLVDSTEYQIQNKLNKEDVNKKYEIKKNNENNQINLNKNSVFQNPLLYNIMMQNLK